MRSLFIDEETEKTVVNFMPLRQKHKKNEDKLCQKKKVLKN